MAIAPGRCLVDCGSLKHNGHRSEGSADAVHVVPSWGCVRSGDDTNRVQFSAGQTLYFNRYQIRDSALQRPR
jgi:hypothetical protein